MSARELLTTARESCGRSLKILIVEDEALVALQIGAFLEDAGHTVLGVADDRASARELARSAASPPDLALVDMRLSNGSRGTDVAADLAAQGIRVLFVTGNCPAKCGVGLALGCLHKPFSQGELVASVAAAQAVMQGCALPHIPTGMHLY